MKLVTKPINNTEKEILEVLEKGDHLTALTLAQRRYPQSKQLDKKAATYTMHLRNLARRGLVRGIETPTGTTWILCNRKPDFSQRRW